MSLTTSRRRFLAGAAATASTAAGIPLLAGCSSDDKQPTGGGGEAAAGLVNVWGGVPAESGPQDLIDAFHKAYPTITAKYTQFVNDPNGNLKLDTALQGGAGIDVFFTYSFPNLAKRANANQMADLTEKVSSDADLKKLASKTYTPRYDGKVYALPTVAETSITFVNKDMAAAAGVTVPDSWTVDEFHQAARKLTNGKTHGSFSNPSVAVATLGPDAGYTSSGQANFTAGPWLTEAKLASAMAKDGSSYPEQQVLSQQLTAYQQNLFLTEKIGLWISGTYNLRFINDLSQYPHKFVTTFAPQPKPTGADKYWNTGNYDNFISVAKSSENQDAAWTFVKYWLTTGAKYMYKAGKLSPLETDTTQATELLLGEQRDKLYDVDAFTRVTFDPANRLGVPKQFAGAPEIATAQTSQTEQLLLGKISPQQWVSNMQKAATSAIAKDS